MAYTTTADVKTYAGITSTADDTLIGVLVTAAQRAIEDYCHRTFESASVTRYYGYDYPGLIDDTLYLDNDLLTVTTLTNGNGAAITAYWLLPRNVSPYQIIRIKSTVVWLFSDLDSEISVAGTWGYSTTAPASIVHATKRLATWLYRQRATSADVERPILAGDGSVILPSQLPNDILKLLEPYRRREGFV